MSLPDLVLCSSRVFSVSKGVHRPSGLAARRGGLGCAQTSLRCSVSWPAANSLRSLRSLRSNMRSESVNEARCARGHEPCASRRRRGRPDRTADARLCGTAGVVRLERQTRMLQSRKQIMVAPAISLLLSQAAPEVRGVGSGSTSLRSQRFATDSRESDGRIARECHAVGGFAPRRIQTVASGVWCAPVGSGGTPGRFRDARCAIIPELRCGTQIRGALRTHCAPCGRSVQTCAASQMLEARCARRPGSCAPHRPRVPPTRPAHTTHRD